MPDLHCSGRRSPRPCTSAPSAQDGAGPVVLTAVAEDDRLLGRPTPAWCGVERRPWRAASVRPVGSPTGPARRGSLPKRGRHSALGRGGSRVPRPRPFRTYDICSFRAASTRGRASSALVSLRQVKPGEGGRECSQPRKPSIVSPAGGSPARQGWPPAGSESCVVAGQPVLRSVDSERDGCVIEPRKRLVGGAERRGNRGGNIGAPQRPGAEIPRGRRATASAQGLIQEPGRPHGLRGRSPDGPPATTGPGSRASGVRPPVRANRGMPPRYR
jgi:hypothetical protein